MYGGLAVTLLAAMDEHRRTDGVTARRWVGSGIGRPAGSSPRPGAMVGAISEGAAALAVTIK